MIKGKDVYIAPTAILKYPQILGSHVTIDMNVYCAVRLYTGDWVHISPMVSIIGGAKSSLHIGNLAGASTGARIICGSEDFVNSLLGFVPDEYRITIHGHNIIENYAWMGAGSIMLPNLILAEGSILGAGAVLTKNTEPWMVYVGNPAKAIKMRNKEKILENAKKMGYV